MASDTFKTKKVGAVYAGPAGHCKKSRLYKVGESGIYPGYAVRATAGAVYLAKNSDKKFSGIAECMGGHDLDAVYTITIDYVELFEVRSDSIVWAWVVAVSPKVNVVPGDIMVMSATDGMLMVFAYADGTDLTDDSEISYVGRSLMNVTGHATNNQLIRIQM